MSTWRQPDGLTDDTIDVPLALPRDDRGPVFAEPWQAQAFALAVTLSRQGYFTWKEWASELAATLRAAADRGEPDDGSRYYDHWLATLERVVMAKGLADQATLIARKDAWTAAYRDTPHGTPVELPQPHSKVDARWILSGLVSIACVYWVIRSVNIIPALDATGSRQMGPLASAVFGSVLGLRHALEPDHLAAVSTLMTGERSSRKAAWLGACWGFGHTMTLMAAGALVVLFRAEMPPVASDIFELCVVLLLVGFGLRAMYLGVWGRPRATHSHVKRRSTVAPDRGWTIARRPLIVGAVHGLAGSGAITALVVTALSSTVARLGYLALFGVGTTVGMTILSGLLGWPLARAGANRGTARALSFVVGGISIALGLWWGHPLVMQLVF
jgi:nitrile hydratase accessory protein